MSVLDRSALSDSSLADLHAIASELQIDGYRRLRRDDLIDSIVDRGKKPSSSGGSSRSGEGSRSRSRSTTRRSSRPQRERRPQARGGDQGHENDRAEQSSRTQRGSSETVVGKIELRRGGSAMLKLAEDAGVEWTEVFVSAAQVRRFKLADGDSVSGPVRPPRRSERYPSLVRVELINGKPTDGGKDGGKTTGDKAATAKKVPFDRQEIEYPSEKIELSGGDRTAKVVDRLAPFGKGSRVLISGPTLSGKSETIRSIAAAIAGQEGLEVVTLLLGVRPEELSEWKSSGVEPRSVVELSQSSDSAAKALDKAISQAKRTAAAGRHAVVIVDSLDKLPQAIARRALSAGRKLAAGGSLTVIATSAELLGGETTAVILDPSLAASRRFPAIDTSVGGTAKVDLLVGESGAKAVAKLRSKGKPWRIK